jgi:hypothetical protein
MLAAVMQAGPILTASILAGPILSGPTPEALARWLAWLEATPFAAALRGSIWLYPIVETLHIAGFTVLVGSAVVFDLRLLGLSRAIKVTDLADHVLPWARRSLAIVVPTGLLLFTTQPTEMAASLVFRWKLTLIGLAGLNALLFHVWTFRSVAAWDHTAPTPLRAKVAGLLSLTLWAGVISCGRFLAYF